MKKVDLTRLFRRTVERQASIFTAGRVSITPEGWRVYSPSNPKSRATSSSAMLGPIEIQWVLQTGIPSGVQETLAFPGYKHVLSVGEDKRLSRFRQSRKPPRQNSRIHNNQA